MVKRKKNRLLTDAFREISRTRNRFLSLFVLAALAVAFLSGLRMTAPDMEYTADRYYDRQNLMDVQVVSTLGLTKEDVDAIRAYDGVVDVEAEQSLDMIAGEEIVKVASLPERVNLLSVKEGRLPQAADECITEQRLLEQLNLQLGDTITLETGTDGDDTLLRTAFTIVGVAESPLYVSTDRGSSSIGSGSITAFLYIPKENFDWDYNTAVYFTVDGMKALDCYSDAYENQMDAYLDTMEAFGKERASLRYEDVIGEAQAELNDAQKEYDEARAEVEQELADAKQELEDAKAELDDGWADYYSGLDQFKTETAQAQETLRDGEQALADAKQELEDALVELSDGENDYHEGLEELNDGEMEYADNWVKLQEAQEEYDAGWTEYLDGLNQLEEAGAQLMEAEKQLESASSQLASGSAALASGRQELAEQKQNYQNLKDAVDRIRILIEERGLTIPTSLELEDPAVMAFAQGLSEWARFAPGELQAGVIDPLRTVLAAFLTQLDPDSEQGLQMQALLAALPEDLDETTDIQPLTTGVLGGLVAAEAGLTAMDQAIESGEAQLDAASASLSAGSAQYQAGREEYEAGKTEFLDSAVQLEEAGQELKAAKIELEDGWAQLEEGRKELDDGWADLRDARQALDDGWAEYNEGLTAYEEGAAELEDGRKELAEETAKAQGDLSDAYVELTRGETDYSEGLLDYEEGKAEAETELSDAEVKLRDARQEIAEIEECEWYLLGRDMNAGLVGYSQDAERVGNLAAIFPVIFFLVAALACLTTMTRMVEEQRTQIGSLKALGFSRRAISVKYIGYAFLASLSGGLVGLAVGCTLIPLVIANAFNIMYIIPDLEFKFQPMISVAAVGAAVLCTTGASLWACLKTLMDTPANLMRPKAPPVGKRVFLEYITPLWNRMSFTWKVTMRNLFRYQRRFWMTVIGIGGCTALVVTGFGLHNSIFDILDKQFDEISVYDASIGLNTELTDGEKRAIQAVLNADAGVDNYLTSYQVNVDTVGADRMVSNVYLFAVEDGEAFQNFMTLRHLKDSSPAQLPEEGVVITQKLSELLELEVGDQITLKEDGRQVSAPVMDIVENYVYHYVYLTEDYYTQLFGEEISDNVLMVRYADDEPETADRISRELMALSGVTSYSNISTIRDSFTDSMTSIDYAVVIIIVSAAALAFVVLYNLTNINITERMRELATLKVLGFYDRETSAYVYRENIFLTLFGILLGLVMGRFLHSWMVLTVEVDLVMFGRTAPPYAYILAAILTAVFSAVVNIVAHYSLKKIDMVESLKTVE